MVDGAPVDRDRVPMSIHGERDGGAPSVDALFEAARGVASRAHAPYSGVRVGAALLDSEGQVHLGCNVENASYGLTVCAERHAVAAAVASGSVGFVRIAIVANIDGAISPCGACRQVLHEFAPDLRVLLEGADGLRREFALGELLPEAFSPSDLEGTRGSAGGKSEDDEDGSNR